LTSILLVAAASCGILQKLFRNCRMRELAAKQLIQNPYLHGA
jgi:hypothetical protein